MKDIRFFALSVVIYVAATVLIYVLAAYFISSIGDLGAIPKVVWILFGPALGLGSGHGIAAYLVASILLSIFLLLAFYVKNTWRFAFVSMAIVPWIAVGWLMS